MENIRDHHTAFVQAFIARRRRQRRLAKPIRELCLTFCHDLPSYLDERRVIPLAGGFLDALPLLRKMSDRREAAIFSCVSGAPSETLLPVEEALEHIDTWDSCVVSIEPGQLACYKAESVEDYRVLLVRDATWRDKARHYLAEA